MNAKLFLAAVLACQHPTTTIENAHIVFDDNAVLVFDSEAAANSMDSRYCTNAVIRKKGLSRRIRRIVSNGRLPAIEVSVIKDFFQDNTFSDNMFVHRFYRNDGAPVDDFCERNDLIVINAVRLDGFR